MRLDTNGYFYQVSYCNSRHCYGQSPRDRAQLSYVALEQRSSPGFSLPYVYVNQFFFAFSRSLPPPGDSSPQKGHGDAKGTYFHLSMRLSWLVELFSP